MFPALSETVSGSDSSRCGSDATAAEKARPCVSPDASDPDAATDSVVTVSEPWYGWPAGATFAEPQARGGAFAWPRGGGVYGRGGRFVATTFSVVCELSLEPIVCVSLDSPWSAL